MDSTFAQFLRERTEARPEARTRLIALHRAFLATLPDERLKRLWPRWRLLAEFEADGYVLGNDEHGITCVAGIHLIPATPRRWTRDEGSGRLRLVEVA